MNLNFDRPQRVKYSCGCRSSGSYSLPGMVLGPSQLPRACSVHLIFTEPQGGREFIPKYKNLLG